VRENWRSWSKHPRACSEFDWRICLKSERNIIFTRREKTPFSAICNTRIIRSSSLTQWRDNRQNTFSTSDKFWLQAFGWQNLQTFRWKQMITKCERRVRDYKAVGYGFGALGLLCQG
jgi:hypothetical protein